ncbi:hypothetical protein CR513_08816, partial [Mucuna pruriens]
MGQIFEKLGQVILLPQDEIVEEVVFGDEITIQECEFSYYARKIESHLKVVWRISIDRDKKGLLYDEF